MSSLLQVVVAVLLVSSLTGAQEEKRNASFPLSPPLVIQQIQRGPDNNSSCAVPETRSVISNALREFLEDDVVNRLPCTPELAGMFGHCPADNCSQILNSFQDGVLHLSNYYWLNVPNGEVTEIYCNRATMQPEYESCVQVYKLNFPSGVYNIRRSRSSPVTVYCDHSVREECGDHFWFKVASYNFTSTNSSCPSEWNQLTSPVRGCGRIATSGCNSVTFSVQGHTYDRVCGRVIAIQRGHSDAFHQVFRGIDRNYVDGVSITHDLQPRNHLWTFAASPGDNFPNAFSMCRCRSPIARHPTFVGNDYFCDTGTRVWSSTPQDYPEDPLWDGEGCSDQPLNTCCAFNNPPWFTTVLPSPVNNDIDVRICGFTTPTEQDTIITMLDLYVQ